MNVIPSVNQSLDYDDINAGLRNYVDQSVQVSNVHEIVESTRTSIHTVQLFFLIMCVIGLLLSFFILWLSFCDKFDQNLSHKDTVIGTKTDDKYGEYEQVQMSQEIYNTCITAVCDTIYTKGDKQS